MTARLYPCVTPCGTGVDFKFADAAANPVDFPDNAGISTVRSVVDNDEQQSILLTGNPAGGAFAVGFGGQTSAPVPAIPTPPYASYLYVISVASGTYDVAANIPRGGNGCPSVLYRLFDGHDASGTQLASRSLSHLDDTGTFGVPSNPAPFPDDSSPTPLQQSGLIGGNGVTLSWYPLARVTVTSGTLAVLVSASNQFGSQDRFGLDLIRLAPVGGGTVRRVPANSGPNVASPNWGYFGGGGGSGYEAWPYPAGGVGMLVGAASGTGTRYLFDPAVLQAALRAMTSIGAGNLTVTGTGSPQDPGYAKFVGTLAEAAHPLLTCPDPAVTIARVASGGILPVIRRADGTSIPIPRSWIYFTPGAMPTVLAFFPQAAPAVQYAVAFQGENSLTNAGGSSWDHVGVSGYTGQVWGTAGSQATAAWFDWVQPSGSDSRGSLPAGTYRLSATWPTAPQFTPSATFTVRDLAGSTLGSMTVNQTVAPSGAVDGGVPWQVIGTFTLADDASGLVVTLSNNSATFMVADSIRIERTSPDTSIRIPAGEAITYSAGAGWATCDAGPAPAATDAPVEDRSGGQLYPALPTTASMRVGTNWQAHNPGCGSFCYQNLMAGSELTAYPTDLGTQFQVQVPLNSPPIVYGADRRTWPSIPPGDYDLWWDGASDLTLTANAGSCVEIGTATITHGANNRRTYRCGGSPWNAGPALAVLIHGTDVGGGHYTTDATNFRVFPAGTDVANPPYFRADWLAREAAHGCGRNMDPLGTIQASPTDFSDFLKDTSPARPTRNAPFRVRNLPVHSVKNYTYSSSDFPHDFDRTQGVALEVTTGDPAGSPAPHGFSRWQFLTWNNYLGPALPLTNGFGDTQDYNPNGTWSGAWVLDATRIVFFAGPHAPAHGTSVYPWTMTGTVAPNPGTYIQLSCGAGTPLDDIIARHNANGSDCYFNVAWSVTDTCLGQLGTYLAQHLLPGVRLRVECSNETWNFGVGGPSGIAGTGSRIYYNSSNDDFDTFTCEFSNHAWGIMRAAWVAAGRDAADFIRVLGSIRANAGTTASRAGYMHAKGYGFDEITVDDYLPNGPSITRPAVDQSAFAPLLRRLTAGQQLTLLEDHYTFGGHEETFAAHVATMASVGVTGVPVCVYEGGPDRMLAFYGEYGPPGFYRLGHQIVHHPRYWGVLVHKLRVAEQGGCTAYHLFVESSADQAGGVQWSAYQYTGQPDYQPGDPAQDDIQLNHYDDMTRVRSVTGGALNHYASLLGATASPDFAVTVTAPGGTTITRGGTLVLHLAATASGGYAGSIGVALSALPSGVTASALTLTPTGYSGDVTLTATSGAALGPATITITAADTASGPGHSRTFGITVAAATAPDFTPSATGGGTLVRGGTLNVPVAVVASGGFADPVAVTLSSPPSGVTAAPLTLTSPGYSGSLIVSASGSATTGPATLTLAFASTANGGPAHPTTAAITVATTRPPSATPWLLPGRRPFRNRGF